MTFLGSLLDFPIPESTAVCNNKMAIIAWGKNPNMYSDNFKTDSAKAEKFLLTGYCIHLF